MLLLKKILQIYSLTFFLLITLNSCEKEFKTKKDYSPSITLNSYISPDTNFSIKLFYNKSPFYSNDFVNIDNAKITISDNINKESLSYTGQGLYETSQRPQIGKQYFIEAEIPGNQKLSAHSFIPNHIKIDTLYTNISVDEQGNKILKIHLTVDVLKPESFMVFKHIVRKKSLSIEKDTIFFQDTAWLAVNSNAGSFILPDNLNKITLYPLVNIGQVNIELNSYDGYKKSDNLLEGISTFEILDCSEDYFEYIKSELLNNLTTKGSQTTIINPIDFYSNINNGRGIFAGYRKLTRIEKFQ